MSFLRPRSQRVYYPQVVTPGTLLAAHSTIYALPFMVNSNFVFDQIGVNVTTAGVGANTEARLGVYADDNGRPGTLLFDSGVITGFDSTGAKVAALAQPHTLMIWANQPYWLASLYRQAATTQPTVAAAAAGGQSPFVAALGVADIASIPSAAAGLPNGFAIGGQSWAALPAAFPAGAPSLNAAIPLVGLRAA